MVTLRLPEPDPPEQGKAFSITASAGVGPYTFKWKIDQGEWTEKTQPEADFEIVVPEGTRGKTLHIEVKDAADEEDSYSNIISG